MSEAPKASLTLEEEVFQRQANAIPPWDLPRGLQEWIPIAPITDNSHDSLRARFPIKFYMPVETTSPGLKPEQRAALLKYLGSPLEPNGPLLPGAPQRAFWWISTSGGRFEGMIMIVDVTGRCFSAYAPQNGRPTVWPANVKNEVSGAVWRSAYRLLALSRGEAPDPRFARSLEVKAKLDAERRAQADPVSAGD